MSQNWGEIRMVPSVIAGDWMFIPKKYGNSRFWPFPILFFSAVRSQFLMQESSSLPAHIHRIYATAVEMAQRFADISSNLLGRSISGLKKTVPGVSYHVCYICQREQAYESISSQISGFANGNVGIPGYNCWCSIGSPIWPCLNRIPNIWLFITMFSIS